MLGHEAIEAEVDEAAAATGTAPTDSEPSSETPQGASEEDAPSEDELNESDDERQASAKGLDDNGTEAVALEKAGLLDSNNPDDVAKVETFIEVAKASAEINDEDSEANKEFVGNLVTNFKNVVDVTEESEDLGLKDKSKIQGFAKNSKQSGDLLAVLGDADQIGEKTADNMDAVFSNPDKATNLKLSIDVAKDTFASGRRNSDGDNEVTQEGKDKMTAMFRLAENADEVASELQSASAKGSDSEQGENEIFAVFKVVSSVDKAEQEKKSAEAAAQRAAEEAAAQKVAEEAAALKAEEELAAALRDNTLSAEEIEAKRAAADLAAKKKAATDAYASGLEDLKILESQTTEPIANLKTVVKNASNYLKERNKHAVDSDEWNEADALYQAESNKKDEITKQIDAIRASIEKLNEDFKDAHDEAVLTELGLDFASRKDEKLKAIKTGVSTSSSFGDLTVVKDLAVTSLVVEKKAKEEEQAAIEAIAAAEKLIQEGGDPDAIAKAQAQKKKAEAAKLAAAKKAEAIGGDDFDKLIENADQAAELKKMVDKNAEIEAAAQKALEDAKALGASAEEIAELEKAAENKADLGRLLQISDKAKDLATVVEAAESLSSGDASTLTALL